MRKLSFRFAFNFETFAQDSSLNYDYLKFVITLMKTNDIIVISVAQFYTIQANFKPIKPQGFCNCLIFPSNTP
jgi:hypothetical protein